MATNNDLQQLLAETWSDVDAARIADQVSWPGNLGHVVRAMQPDADDRTVLLVDEDICIEIHRHFGVDVDHAGGPEIWDALEAVHDVLTRRWADGGTLATVALDDRVEARDILTRQLSLKAAERAGCDITGTHPDYTRVPLDIGGQLRIDVGGLDTYLEDRRTPPEPAELDAINRLRTVARRA